MQSKQSIMAIVATASLATASLFTVIPNSVATNPTTTTIRLIGLTSDNQLVSFRRDRPNQLRSTPIQDVDGRVIGIDVRPSNGLLYGLTNTDKIYTINPTTGKTKLISTLSKPFKGNIRTGIDFNPVPDRLRLVDARKNNFRIDVESGTVSEDKQLNYAANDVNGRAMPEVTAAAYTNAFFGPPSPPNVTPPTRTTQLFDIDSKLDVLVLQSPPNDGTLTTIGPLGVDFRPTGEFDIFSPRPGVNFAFAVSGSTFYSIDLGTGAATAVGTAGEDVNLIGLTFTIVPPTTVPPTTP